MTDKEFDETYFFGAASGSKVRFHVSKTSLSPTSSFSIDRSMAVPLLQLFVCASVVSF